VVIIDTGAEELEEICETYNIPARLFDTLRDYTQKHEISTDSVKNLLNQPKVEKLVLMGTKH